MSDGPHERPARNAGDGSMTVVPRGRAVRAGPVGASPATTEDSS